MNLEITCIASLEIYPSLNFHFPSNTVVLQHRFGNEVLHASHVAWQEQ